MFSSETKRRLVLGSGALLRESGLRSMSWFVEGSVSNACQHPATCRETIKEVIKRLCTNPDVTFALDHPESAFCDFCFAELCPSCRSEATATHLEGRQETFGVLPTLFGLGPWDDLKDDI